MTLTLGKSRKGRAQTLSNEERSRHVHIIGASGTGKSKLLESLIRQDIKAGRGLCLIDPHGTLSDEIVKWCAALNISKHRRIHVLDLKNENWSVGFNPLGYNGHGTLESRVDAMVNTCAEIWGGEDPNQTPLLTTCLQLIFYALARNQLTLAEAIDLTASVDPKGIRAKLTMTLENPVYEAYWRDLCSLGKKDFEERFSSARRRLLRFLGTPAIKRIIGQRMHSLNLRQIMDQGDILLINLAKQGVVSDDNAQLIGALLLSEMRLCALGRDPVAAKRKPFSLYIDECYQYLTGDIESMLDETRKFGLHLILAHQRLGQLSKRDDTMLNAVMAGGQTKIIFGGMNDEDAEYMARQVFRSSFRTDRVKHVLDKSVVVDEVPFWLESEGSTDSESSTDSSSESSGWGTSSSSAEGLSSQLHPISDEVLGLISAISSSIGESASGSSTSSYSATRGSSTTQGRSQTLKPVRVVMPTAVFSLEEELHLATVKLRELPNQAAIVKRRGRPPVRFQPSTVSSPVVGPRGENRFIAEVRTESPYIISAEQADAEISLRSEGLGQARSDELKSSNFWQD